MKNTKAELALKLKNLMEDELLELRFRFSAAQELKRLKLYETLVIEFFESINDEVFLARALSSLYKLNEEDNDSLFESELL